MKQASRHLLVGLASGIAAWLFGLTPAGEFLELRGYDILHVSRIHGEPPANIVIVAIDEPSFAELRQQWPWPRSLHAKLIDALKRSGASVIAMDIMFTEPSAAQQDKALAAAIERAGNVVLASDVILGGDAKFQQEMLAEPIPEFGEHAKTGIVSFQLDRDYVVRRLPYATRGEMLFAEQVANIYTGRSALRPEGVYIDYPSPPASFPTASYYQAIEPEGSLPMDFFRGKIVMVGRATSASPEPERERVDYFATPFLFHSSATSRLMSGVEIHAAITANFINNEFVRRLSGMKRMLLLLFLGVLGSALQARWRPLGGALAAAAAWLIWTAAAYLAFSHSRLWTPTIITVLPFALPYSIFGAFAYITGERKKQEIRRAFSHYLSPAVLECVLADPDNLRIGGRRVEGTVLFSDIADFTVMSEKLEPEAIANLLNEYLNAMSGIILRHNGTIDKFIGDAIMAFWGAPLSDPAHALNACRVAVAMQARLVSLREELRAKGLPDIHARIGINSGLMIAGNMGSSDLFDYTVIGDTVNLASRLEGANKRFGTGILISGSTYALVSDAVIARPLGKISLKGKSEEVEVYELIEVP